MSISIVKREGEWTLMVANRYQASRSFLKKTNVKLTHNISSQTRQLDIDFLERDRPGLKAAATRQERNEKTNGH